MADRFPNYFGGTVTESSADTFTTLQVTLPTAVTAQGAQVMEILWIDFWVDTKLNAADEQFEVQIVSGSKPTALLTFDDPRVIADLKFEVGLLTSGAILIPTPTRANLMTADGFGFLFPGSNFHFNVKGTSTGVTGIGRFKCYYRFVPLTTAELNGLISSLLRT